MTQTRIDPGKCALLFLACVLFHVLGTWSLPLIDRDEPRFAEASREMIERGDYIVPYFNNQLRLDKPPLTYWAQAASYRIFGENDFAARFPSAVAAALTALLLLAWGRRVGGEKVGWYAAIIFTLSLQTFVHAKAAVADMWLVLCMALAHWAGYELMVKRESRSENGNTKWWLMFYFALAIGFLAKGPIAWIPLLTVSIMKLFDRNLLLALRFKFLRGFLLTLAIVALWGVPALIGTHGEFFAVGIGRHVISRSFATMEGHGANSFGMYLLLLPFYFVTVFVSFFPWSIKLPWLTQKLWRERKAGALFDTYLLAGITVIFIIFTLVSTKLPHYTLPAFPLLSLLLARHWLAPSAATESRRLFTRISVTIACIWIAMALVIPPIVARFFPAYQLLRESRTDLEPNMQFGSVEFEEPSVVWYFRSRVKGFLTPLNKRRAVEFMGAPGLRFIILPTPVAGELFATQPQSWRFFSTSGFNIARGKRVDLTLVLKPE